MIAENLATTVDDKTSNTLVAGTTIEGRYEIIESIGLGGFARIYRARHTRIDTEVAIKVLSHVKDDLRRNEQEERFLDEARLTAGLRHPNAVRVFDYGRIEGTRLPYIAMELLQGHDLSREMALRGKIPADRAVALLGPALGALGEAHGLGIVHKDLKPENLFLRYPGTHRESLVLMDFGVARVRGGDRRTLSGQVFGTPQYLSPEYIESQIATPALDVYQMGLILAEMVTGKPVLGADDFFECLTRHCTGKLELPLWLMRGPLGPIIHKATAREHRLRYTDANAFQKALGEVDKDALVRAAQARPGYTPTLAGGRPRPKRTHIIPTHWRKASLGASLMGLMAPLVIGSGLPSLSATAIEPPPTALAHAITVNLPTPPTPRLMAGLVKTVGWASASTAGLSGPLPSVSVKLPSIDLPTPAVEPAPKLVRRPIQKAVRKARPAPKAVVKATPKPVSEPVAAKPKVKAAAEPLTIGRPR